MSDLTLWGVLFAGLISFLSPCVLPLVPPYLTYLAGASLKDITTAETGFDIRRRMLLNGLFFVFGFSTIFILLGATATTLGQILRAYSDVLSTLAGVAIIVMGLHFLGFFRIALLFREARFAGGAGAMGQGEDSESRGAGAGGSYIMGLAFAFGWTPCIGPVLGAIIPVAGAQDTVVEGMLLFAVYSAGLGIPFILAALFAERFMRFLTRFRGSIGAVEKLMGVLLVLTGIAFLGGFVERAAYGLLEAFPALGQLG